jgi:hypothetical protein
MRDKTKFIKVDEFKQSDLLSDYHFLEEQSRLVNKTQRDTLKRHYDITPSMDYLKKLAFNKYSIYLKYMPRHSTKRLANRTRFDKETKLIHWHVDIKFFASPKKSEQFTVNGLCSSDDLIKSIIQKFYKENQQVLFLRGQVLYNFDGALMSLGPELNVLLEVFDYKSKRKYHSKLDLNKTLANTLHKKSVIEYPTLIIVLNENLNEFNIKNDLSCREEGELGDDDDEYDYEQDAQEKEEVNRHSYFSFLYFDRC